MVNEKMHIGQMIKDIRKARGLTQRDLAEFIGVSYQQVQKYEKGMDNVSVARLKQIAKAVDIPITKFFPGSRKLRVKAFEKKMSKEEVHILRLYRKIKSKKSKKTLIEFLKKSVNK